VTKSPDAPKPQTFSGEIFSLLGDFTRVSVFVVGLFYVAGLLIKNVDLGRMEIVDLDLARPEYILIGATWFVLIVTPTILYLWAREIVHRSRKQGLSWHGFKEWGRLTIVVSGFFYLVS
jgi:hypothetical protein